MFTVRREQRCAPAVSANRDCKKENEQPDGVEM